MRRERLDVAGRPAECLRVEREGPPLVLLHGAGANADVWEPLLPHLDAFDLAAPSLPGRLGSEGAAHESAAEAAGWVDALLEALGGPPALVLGHSYGGGVALELALRSARVAGLVLVASGARLRVHPSILEMASLAVRTREPTPTRFAFSADADPAVIARYEEAAQRTPPEATLADWRACDAFDRLDALARVSLPTLVIGGADDALTPPKYQEHLAERLPRGQLVLMEGTGHMVAWERAAQVGREVRAWAAATA